jgi:hypothetical protein
MTQRPLLIRGVVVAMLGAAALAACERWAWRERPVADLFIRH